MRENIPTYKKGSKKYRNIIAARFGASSNSGDDAENMTNKDIADGISRTVRGATIDAFTMLGLFSSIKFGIDSYDNMLLNLKLFFAS